MTVEWPTFWRAGLQVALLGPSLAFGSAMPVRASLGSAQTMSVGAPLVEVGEELGGPVEFGTILDAVLLPDGRYAVADDLNHRIVLLSENGQMLGTFGREGEGPGEFRYLYGLDVDGEGRLLAWDLSLHRITRFDAGGGVQTARLALGTASGLEGFSLHRLVGVSEDGRLVLSAILQRGLPPGVPTADSVAYLLFEPNGTWVRTLHSFQGMVRVAVTAERGYGSGPHPVFGYPFAAIDGYDLVASNGRGSFVIRAPLDGGPSAEEPSPLSTIDVPDAIEAFWDAVNSSTAFFPSLKQFYDTAAEARYPFEPPSLSGMKAAADDGIWLQQFCPGRDGAALHRYIGDSGGVWRSLSGERTVALPADFSPLRFYRYRVLGFRRGEWDQPVFVVLSLHP